MKSTSSHTQDTNLKNFQTLQVTKMEEEVVKSLLTITKYLAEKPSSMKETESWKLKIESNLRYNLSKE